MIHPRLRARLFGLAGALLAALVLPATAVRAQVSINAVVTPSGGLFNYSYSVTNNLPMDPADPTVNRLAIISFAVPARADAVLNKMAPTGFLIDFDPGVGLVSFAEDADSATPQTFAPGLTVAGFTFQSPFGPLVTQFEAISPDGTFRGNVVSPLNVPEPGTLLIGLAALPGLALPLRRVLRSRRSAR